MLHALESIYLYAPTSIHMLYLVAAGQLKNVSAWSSMPKDMLTKELTKLKSIAGGQNNDDGIRYMYKYNITAEPPSSVNTKAFVKMSLTWAACVLTNILNLFQSGLWQVSYAVQC